MTRTGVIKKNHGKTAEPSHPRLLTLKKAAEYLGLTIWAMRERIWSGDVPIVRFPGGRKVYIDVRDLDGLIEHNKIRYA